VREPARPVAGAWRHHRSHLEKFDQRAAPGQNAVAFEQRLPLDWLEREVLSERVHEVEESAPDDLCVGAC